MKMIPGSGPISNYGSYISNCTRHQMPYKVPVNSLADVQLYINIGAVKPTTVLYELIYTCGPDAGTVQTLSAPDYVVGQDRNNNWYGVFKNFSAAEATCFVIAITLDSQIYFSEEYCIENSCGALVLIKGCYGNLDPLVSTDCEGIYFGVHAGIGTAMGDTLVKYEHQLLLRGIEVTLSAVKNSFKQGRTRNFRTEKEKIFQFWSELVPEWYLSEIDAVFYRGEVYIGSTKYLLNETQFEKVEDCFKMWKPWATLKESCYQSFSCEADPCAAVPAECCDPEVTSVVVSEVPFESGFPVDSGGPGGGVGGSNIVVVQAVVDQVPNVTGTFEAVTGIVNGSTVVTCNAFASERVFVERGNIQIPGIDPLDGSQYYIKVFADNFITFSTPLVSGEFIYIETIR